MRTPATVGIDLTSGLVRFVSADSVVFDLRAVYTDGMVASSRGTAGQDTTRVTTPFQVVRRLSGGALHLRSAGGEDIAVSASLTAAPALRATARGHHVVLNGDGTGISWVP